MPLTLAVFDVWGRLAETGSRNKSQLVAIESARLEQRRGTLTFDKINEACRLLHGEFSPLILAVFDVWGRVAETGSGNKWPLVALRVLDWNNLETC